MRTLQHTQIGRQAVARSRHRRRPFVRRLLQPLAALALRVGRLPLRNWRHASPCSDPRVVAPALAWGCLPAGFTHQLHLTLWALPFASGHALETRKSHI